MGGEGLPGRGWMRRRKRLKDEAPGMEGRERRGCPGCAWAGGRAECVRRRRFGRRGAGDAPTVGEPSEGAADSGTGHFDGGGLRRRTDGARASLAQASLARPWRFGRFRRGGWSAVDFGARDGMQGIKRRVWVRGGRSREIERKGRSAGIGHWARGLSTGHWGAGIGRRTQKTSEERVLRGSGRAAGRVFKFGIAEGGGRQPQIMRPTRVPAQATR